MKIGSETARICVRLRQELLANQPLSFIVHSVFEQAINLLDTQGRMITFLSTKKPMQPYSIAIHPLPSVVVNDTVTVTDGCFYCHDRFLFRWDMLPTYDPQVALTGIRNPLPQLYEAMKELSLILRENGNTIGMLPLVFPDCAMVDARQLIKQVFAEWVTAYRNRDEKRLLDASVELCGFGPGLTPSADDFLCGAMITWIYLCYYTKQPVEVANNYNRQLIAGFTGRTNRISMHLLTMASYGFVSEVVQELMKALFLKDRERKEAVKAVMAFGASSGTDFLCGVYVAMKYALQMPEEMTLSSYRDTQESKK